MSLSEGKARTISIRATESRSPQIARWTLPELYTEAEYLLTKIRYDPVQLIAEVLETSEELLEDALDYVFLKSPNERVDLDIATLLMQHGKDDIVKRRFPDLYDYLDLKEKLFIGEAYLDDPLDRDLVIQLLRKGTVEAYIRNEDIINRELDIELQLAYANPSIFEHIYDGSLVLLDHAIEFGNLPEIKDIMGEEQFSQSLDKTAGYVCLRQSWRIYDIATFDVLHKYLDGSYHNCLMLQVLAHSPFDVIKHALHECKHKIRLDDATLFSILTRSDRLKVVWEYLSTGNSFEGLYLPMSIKDPDLLALLLANGALSR